MSEAKDSGGRVLKVNDPVHLTGTVAGITPDGAHVSVSLTQPDGEGKKLGVSVPGGHVTFREGPAPAPAPPPAPPARAQSAPPPPPEEQAEGEEEEEEEGAAPPPPAPKKRKGP